MLGNVLGLAILIALAALFAWLATRAWRARSALVRWPGLILSGLLVMIFAAATVASGIGLYKFYTPRNIAVKEVQIQGTPEQIARGEHLASVVCAGCHSVQGTVPLSGGFNLSADTGMPLGDIYPPNLTPAGELAGWSDGEILRGIREGVHKSGRIMLMPAANLRNLSDEDVYSVIAYLRSQPAVQNPVPPVQPSLLAAALFGAGVIDVNVVPVDGPVTAPPKAPTVEYGKYIVSYSDCRDCHGPNLDGQAKPPAPAGPNLTLVVPRWTQEQFFTAMRTGVTPTGRTLKPPMPWKQVGMLDDVELAALYEYLHGLKPQ